MIFPHDFFNIQQIGINPEEESSACWRGYVAEFSIYDNNLILKNLNTNNSNGNALPVEVNGVMPDVEIPDGLVEGYREWRNWHYRDVHLIIPYSGSILITDEFIRKRYIHMGFQSPLSYRKVIELSFDNGNFIEKRDLSKIFAKLRKIINMESHEEQLARLPLWIEECFDLSYNTKFPK